MQLAPMRYVKIDGTAVGVTVASATEAKARSEGAAPQEAGNQIPARRAAAATKGRAPGAQQAQAATRRLLRRLCATCAALVAAIDRCCHRVAQRAQEAQPGRDRARARVDATRCCTTSRAASCSSQGKLLTATRVGCRGRTLSRRADGVHSGAGSVEASAASRPDCGQFGEVGDDQIGLVRRLAERPPAAVDEGGAHAEGLGADAVEGVVGDEQNRWSGPRPMISSALA